MSVQIVVLHSLKQEIYDMLYLVRASVIETAVWVVEHGAKGLPQRWHAIDTVRAVHLGEVPGRVGE